jgi:hypothetical protein
MTSHCDSSKRLIVCVIAMKKMNRELRNMITTDNLIRANVD